MKIVVWNILDLIDEYGEDSTREVLSAFSCKREIAGESKSLNPDIEHFIKNHAINSLVKRFLFLILSVMRMMVLSLVTSR